MGGANQRSALEEVGRMVRSAQVPEQKRTNGRGSMVRGFLSFWVQWEDAVFAFPSGSGTSKAR